MTASLQATCVAIEGRGVIIDGKPGSGKSSLALKLIDRGAQLIGDDSLNVLVENDRLIAMPHPRTAGLIEVRNLGLLKFPFSPRVPVALAIRFDPHAPRFVEAAEQLTIHGIALPLLRLWPDDPLAAIKVELGLREFGLKWEA